MPIRNRWTVVVVASVTAMFGYALKSVCATSDWGGDAHTYTNLCYSDIGPLYYLRGLANGVVPYFQDFHGQYVEYPVLTGVTMWIAALVVRGLTGGASTSLFVFINWLFNITFILLAVSLLARTRTSDEPQRGTNVTSRAAWWFALSPALLFTLGINWDALAVLFTIAAILAWQSGRSVVTGVAIGSGAAAKLFPALLLVPIAIDAIRNRSWRSALETFIASFGSWLLINFPFAVFAHTGWADFYHFSSTRGIDFGSPWLSLRDTFDIRVTTQQANLAGVLAVGLTAVALLLLRNRIDFLTGVFVIVAVFILFNKVYSPQYWLWITPLAALTAINLRAFALWNLAQFIYFVAIWRYLLFLTDPLVSGGISSKSYGWTIVIQWLSTLALIIYAAWRSPRPRKMVQSGADSDRLEA